MIDNTIDDSLRQKYLTRVKNQSFINNNKRRTFLNNEGMKRWVGSTINFEDPKVEKVSIKLSKKLKR